MGMEKIEFKDARIYKGVSLKLELTDGNNTIEGLYSGEDGVKKLLELSAKLAAYAVTCQSLISKMK
jgi:hypothetical protein